MVALNAVRLAQEWRRSKRLCLPSILMFLMSCQTRLHGHIPHDIQVAEWMSGAGHLKASAHRRNLGAMTYEVLDDSVHQDFTRPEGMLEAILIIMRMSVQSLSHWDTCCSNWVWMSRSQHGGSHMFPGSLLPI